MIGENTQALEVKLERWREGLEISGLKIVGAKMEFLEFGLKWVSK